MNKPFLLIVILIAIFSSWLMNAMMVKLITLCFGLTFSWATATGIWLILWLLGSVFGGKK